MYLCTLEEMFKKPEKDILYFHDHWISRDGKVIRADGRAPSVIRQNKRLILVYMIGCKKHYKSLPALMAELFLGIKPKECFIEFRDNDNSNFALDNLIVYPKKTAPTRSRFTKAEAEAIYAEYHKDDGREDEKRKNNYRSYQTDFSSYRKLAEKYNCSLSTITKILNGTYHALNLEEKK